MSRDPRRILLTTDAVGGVWVYTLDLAGEIARRHAQVDIAILGPAPTPEQIREAEAAGATIHITGLPLDWTAPSAETLAAASHNLAALARRLGVCLVQLHTPALAAPARFPAPVLAVLHSCVGTWWRAVRGDAPPPPDFCWRMEALAAGLAAADAIIAPTTALADAAREIYATGCPIRTVHNGRDPAWPARRPETPAGILAAGRLWDAAKNIALLDQAAAKLDIPIQAAGPLEGPNGASITLRAVKRLGPLSAPAMQAAIANARIFASPALYEPFGLAVLEAAQSGLPLVLADIPSFRELWSDAAIFLPPKAPNLWATTLRDLHVSPKLCRHWGFKSQTRAARYTQKRCAAAMWNEYRALLAPAARASAA
jgi:glycosyltransferase involved in cell wall biosynthesis